MGKWFRELAVFVTAFFISSLFAGGVPFLFAGTVNGTAEIEKVVQGNNRFALELFRKISSNGQDNLIFSPFSISCALAMAYEGAKGNTKKQMASVFHFSLPSPKFLNTYSSLIKDLEQNKDCKIYIANALWGQKDYNFLEAFKVTINEYFKGGFNEVGFGTPGEASKKINSWVARETKEEISGIINASDLSDLTRLILTNAIYFKGPWISKFKSGYTKPMPFYISARDSISVDMMYQKGNFRYSESEFLQVLELPYKGGKLSMIILLPRWKRGQAMDKNALLNSLENIEHYLRLMRVSAVKVYLPRFKVGSEFSLGKTLKAMGMPDAFSDAADFSGMADHSDLKIGEVIHKAKVKINEEGTKASAATAVVMVAKGVGKKIGFFLLFSKRITPLCLCLCRQ